MKHGSAEARRLFPCLLELPLLLHKDLFINESSQVPEWMFLTWVSQLLASLDTEIGSVLARLLVQLATVLPEDVQTHDYPITNLTVNSLKPLLALDTQTATTVQALACVCQPHYCLVYHLDRLITALAQDTDSINEIYLQMKTEAYPPEGGDRIKGMAFSDLKKIH
ncbi:uncharacterized protein LOC124373841, partial [Homalodisca vitripennis]|uniref:uncharacterized protein LOC124373841 n=1 Tax=Homalodisca vitripennis TaxID=197043 RepID=UPI001EECA81B